MRGPALHGELRKRREDWGHQFVLIWVQSGEEGNWRLILYCRVWYGGILPEH